LVLSVSFFTGVLVLKYFTVEEDNSLEYYNILFNGKVVAKSTEYLYGYVRHILLMCKLIEKYEEIDVEYIVK
jgi:hypothetical protein